MPRPKKNATAKVTPSKKTTTKNESKADRFDSTTANSNGDDKSAPGNTQDQKPARANGTTKTTTPSKRKAPQSPEEQAEQKPPSKTAQRSKRSAPPSQTDPLKTINVLLSPNSLQYCRPHDEISALATETPTIRTYSSSTFTPFEELLCAVILSRPISHALGVRSIRTLLNAPHSFTTPQKIQSAGYEGVRAALDEARTQHRQKTAEEIVGLADAVGTALGDSHEDISLERVREESGNDVERERELLKKSVKGLGKTGLDIFFRRVQAVWTEVYPFVDGRTGSALEKFGLPGDAEELRMLLEEKWSELDVGDVDVKDEDEKKRRVFVRLLERAVGADLEGNIDDVKAEA